MQPYKWEEVDGMNALGQAWEICFQREQERQEKTVQKDQWRPLLHVAPPFGWLNDPNGLCQYRGTYHAFYQFAPFQADCGLKFWGHCTSSDLLHWQFQGAPLMPDEPFDCHGVYSGSALVEDGKMYLYYTGNVKKSGDYDYVNDGRESSTVLAVSEDGFCFEGKELLMTNADYPADITLHVRDPKVWKQDGVYYMVQGARTKDNVGVVLIFSSEDKRNWHYIGRIEPKEKFGYMWECPDLFELDGQTVLCVSPQGVEQDGLKYANKYQSGICLLDGDFRGRTKPGAFRELDGGFDFYAPQSFQAEDGRRILIGWMGMADDGSYTNKTVLNGWQNTLTLPRELSLEDGIVCQNPVRELDGWWNEEISFKNTFQGKTDTCFELDLHPEGGDVRVTLFGGLMLRYLSKEKIFRMEFTDRELGCGRTMRGREMELLTDMRIVADVSCVEVFLNGGRDVFSTRCYPKEGQCEAEAEMKGRGRYRRHI